MFWSTELEVRRQTNWKESNNSKKTRYLMFWSAEFEVRRWTGEGGRPVAEETAWSLHILVFILIFSLSFLFLFFFVSKLFTFIDLVCFFLLHISSVSLFPIWLNLEVITMGTCYFCFVTFWKDVCYYSVVIWQLFRCSLSFDIWGGWSLFFSLFVF